MGLEPSTRADGQALEWPMDGCGGKTEGLYVEARLDDERVGVSRASLCIVLLFTGRKVTNGTQR